MDFERLLEEIPHQRPDLFRIEMIAVSAARDDVQNRWPPRLSAARHTVPSSARLAPPRSNSPLNEEERRIVAAHVRHRAGRPGFVGTFFAAPGRRSTGPRRPRDRRDSPVRLSRPAKTWSVNRVGPKKIANRLHPARYPGGFPRCPPNSFTPPVVPRSAPRCAPASACPQAPIRSGSIP